MKSKMKCGMQCCLAFSVAALFIHCAAVAKGKTFTVAADGSGDFKTVQEAIAAVPDYSAQRVLIHINSGKYQGQVDVAKNKPNITLEGDGAGKTILSWNRSVFDPIPKGSHFFNPGVHVEADDFRATNLTIQNEAGDRGQALALLVDSDRVVIDHCRILGWQDTLMVNNGAQYFKNCYIEGRVDFIYGSASALFDHCEIHSKNGGFVTAANTPQNKPFGLVFLNCRLTGDPDPWIDPATGHAKSTPGALAFLARPWGPYSDVAFINCSMDDHIRPEGWNNWGKAENEKTARYSEYGSKTLDGKPLDLSQRAPWAKRLTPHEAASYTISNVLTAGWNTWDPTSPDGKPAPGVVVNCAARDARLEGTGARIENGGANVGYWNNTDTKLAWDADVQPGVYRVGLSYAIETGHSGSELQIAVGSKVFNLTPPATGGWESYSIFPVGEVTVTHAGKVPVVIVALSNKSNFIANVRGVVLSRK